ncbi:MAG: hypothetical protein RIC15_01535 [Vicingaceae bacterium]
MQQTAFALLFGVLIGNTTLSHAQMPEHFQAILRDENNKSVGGAMIRNHSTKQLAVSDSAGYFSISANLGDSLLIMAMGYEFRIFNVTSFSDRFIELISLSIQLNEVEIVDERSWEDFERAFLSEEIPKDNINDKGLPKGKINPIPPQYRSNEFPDGPHVGNYILNPISSIASAINKDEKQKRRLRKQMILEQKMRCYLSAINADTIRTYLEVPDSLIESFVVYCHSNIENKFLDNTYYYQEMVRNLYPEFKKSSDQK